MTIFASTPCPTFAERFFQRGCPLASKATLVRLSSRGPVA